MDSIVIGGGMVGVATALALQERGRNVLLLDRRRPGQETSYGNAGIIQAEAVAPYAIPLAFDRLLRIAAGRAHDVAWNLRGMPSWLAPVLGYFWHSLPPNYRRIVPEYARMILRATDDHARLITAASADDLIARRGFIQAYRDAASLEAAVAEADAENRAFGVPSIALDAAGLAKAEPTLRVPMTGAIHFTSPWSCRDPGELVSRYARLFIERGGCIETANAQSLARSGGGWTVQTSAGTHDAPDVVVALGPWTPQFLAPLGYRIPMVLKRGYHLHLAGEAEPLQPFMDVANATVISPMNRGVRVLTGAELNRLDANSNLRQIRHATMVAKTLFPLGEAVESQPWRGARPCMPEMLPVIGPASRHQGLWFNFGHGHQGFTLGPTTAQMLADAMVGASPVAALAAFARY
ncbi:FAD-dependent oxidoreductase [Devosia sp. ZB163]|uniref:NAD(P)/FAD-dependent oxidoreductase n=1 Tax=Devosia sp. ZB163 TaxID=3025938 RepID=UPI00236077DA|nr:FAD-dependent oxidoreductase [Devosia sp. ZB163]MDC9822772.1 FAD-dependent oxidoreductase [Devosia sp. ZB163]